MTDLAQQLAQILTPQPSTQIGWLFAAKVARVDDPEELHRIKIEIPARDGQAESDWFFYCSPSASINLDLPVPGRDMAICAYLDGRVDQGIWLGVLINYNTRPPFSPNDGDIVIAPPGNLRLNAGGNHAELTSKETLTVACEVSETSLKLQADTDVVIRSGLLEANIRNLVEE